MTRIFGIRLLAATCGAGALALSAGAVHAQFSASNWWTNAFGIGGAPVSPASQVTNLSDAGFRYVADSDNLHVVAQKLGAALELEQPGDRVTLSFDLKMNGGGTNGDGRTALRVWMTDSQNASQWVNGGVDTNGDGTPDNGSGGGDGFAFGTQTKVEEAGGTGGNEHFPTFATNIGTASQFAVDPSGLGTNYVGGSPLRANTASNTTAQHFIGNDLNDVHRLELSATLMNDGLYLVRYNHINVTQGMDFTAQANERLFSNLWRDPLDDSLGFDGFAFTVQEIGLIGNPFDFEISNLSMVKDNVGVPGVDANGKFYVDFLGRRDYTTGTDTAWIEQEGDDEAFSWAPFMLEGTANIPDPNDSATAFVNPALTYANVFGPGEDLTITVDAPKASVNGFNAPSQVRLGANHLSAIDPDLGDSDMTVTLDLPAGTFEVTTFHHLRQAQAHTTGDIEVTDANGTTAVATGVVPSNETLAAGTPLTTVTFTVESNGADDVVLRLISTSVGDFSNVNGGDFPLNGLTILPVAAPPQFAADFDGDGDVDGDDLARWETAFAANGDADADGDGVSVGRDLLVWQREFGAGVAEAAAQAVPEPASGALLGGICACLVGGRRRR